MAELYTPQSNTQPGTAQQAFEELLKSIRNAPPANSADLASAQDTATAQSLAMGVGQQDFTNQTQQNLTQQAGIPALQGQYGDLAKAFELYLHDSNLASQYQGANTNPYANAGLLAAGQGGNGQISGEVGQAPNPYMGPVEQLLASTQGGITPSQGTAMMGAPIKGTANIMDLLNTAIGGQQKLVGTQTDFSTKNYQSKMKALGDLAAALGDAYKTAQDKANKKRETGFNKDGDLVDTQTGEIIKSYDGGTNAFGQKMSTEALGYIDDIKPNISWATVGPVGKTLGNVWGTPAYGFAQSVEGLKGNLRVTTLSELKAMGGTMGQLSNEEGRALESAIGRLDVGMNPDDFTKQLTKIENYLIKAYAPANDGTKNQSTSNSITQSDGTVWKKNSDGSYTRTK